MLNGALGNGIPGQSRGQMDVKMDFQALELKNWWHAFQCTHIATLKVPFNFKKLYLSTVFGDHEKHFSFTLTAPIIPFLALYFRGLIRNAKQLSSIIYRLADPASTIKFNVFGMDRRYISFLHFTAVQDSTEQGAHNHHY